MNRETIKKYSVLLAIPLIAVAGIFFFFYHFGHNDDVALANFSAAYIKFDIAISAFSEPVFASNAGGSPAVSDLERKADDAFTELNTKASARISSLTRHDAEIMSTTLEIADLSRQQLDTLKAYQKALAAKNADLQKLAKEFGDLTNQRQAAYTRFRELTGIKN